MAALDRVAALAEGRRVISEEAGVLGLMAESLDGTFADVLEAVLACEGKVFITGMGKPGHIARKLAATLSSLGTPSVFLHPAEAMHGDLGSLDPRDLVIAISYSGESGEITGILPNIRALGCALVAITGNPSSTLAAAADIVQVLPGLDEACRLGLAPTSSTTAVLAYGDALAVAASAARGFTAADFGRRHPAGSLGKRLVLRVGDLMAKGEGVPSVPEGSALVDAITEIARAHLGAACVTAPDGALVGIVTDGDVRRAVSRRADIYSSSVDDVMSSDPKCAASAEFAFDALSRIRELDVNCLPVVDGGKLVGLVTWRQIVGAGIVG